MCGICGWINHDRSEPVELDVLRRMTRSLAHRGPDDEGVWSNSHVGLGHRRLSVIDLSPAGHQPMTNEDGSLWITFNGEIYNFRSLREELVRTGHRFASATDTEVVLHLYEELGEACVSRLRGMFAFGLWDGRRQQLLLARDRVGKKPLYYAQTTRGLVFASELKALLQHPDVTRTPDPVALHHYLSYQYVPHPWCALAGVSKLPPAHYLIYRDGRTELRRYWKLHYEPKWPAGTADQRRELQERAATILAEAVRVRLTSDVPLGAFLSGGIDSGTVVALMRQVGGRAVHTFTVGFEEAGYDERPYARQVAAALGTSHTEFVVRPALAQILPQLARQFDEPFADSSAVPTFYLCREARRHVTVALTGDGGDESFAGYPRYVTNRYVPWVNLLLRAGGSRLLHPLVRRWARGQPYKDFWCRLDRWLEESRLGAPLRNARRLWHFDAPLKARLYAPAFAEQLGAPDSFGLLAEGYAACESRAFLDQALAADVSLYLPGALLTKLDITAMAHGLEPRCPLLDHEVMEFAARLPIGMKVGWTTTKHFLRAVGRRWLPEAILRRPKQGFGIPIDEWLRTGLKPLLLDAVLAPRALARGYFEPLTVRTLVEEHLSGRHAWGYQLWNLLMLELWHREVLEARP